MKGSTHNAMTYCDIDNDKADNILLSAIDLFYIYFVQLFLLHHLWAVSFVVVVVELLLSSLLTF